MSKLRQQLQTFLSKGPTLGKGVYIAKGAVVIGDVTLGAASSVWFNAVLRGDINRIGMGSTILDGAVIGKQSIIGAGALVTQGARIPPGSLVLGAPAKVLRKLTPKERARIKTLAQKYVEIAAYYTENQI